MIKRTIVLRLSFTRPDADAAARTVRALLKWLLRTWGFKCEGIAWEDE